MPFDGTVFKVNFGLIDVCSADPGDVSVLAYNGKFHGLFLHVVHLLDMLLLVCRAKGQFALMLRSCFK